MIVDRNWAKPSGGGGGNNTKLKEIVEGTITELTAEDLEGVEKIKMSLFYGNGPLRYVELPNSVKEIGSSAFQNSDVENNVLKDTNVETIGSSAFYSCAFTVLDIPNSVKEIGSNAFNNCKQLTTLTIGYGVKKIGGGAFAGCTNLESVNFLGTIKDWVNITFSGYYLPTYYTHSLLVNGEELTSISSVELLGATQLGGLCYCYNLTNVEIPQGITKIQEYAFYYCTGLSNITMGQDVTTIERYALAYTAFSSITIPESVTNIAASVFYRNTVLKQITILATTPPTLGGTNAIPSNVSTIYIPAGTLSAYQTATNWASFSSKFVELPAE